MASITQMVARLNADTGVADSSLSSFSLPRKILSRSAHQLDMTLTVLTGEYNQLKLKFQLNFISENMQAKHDRIVLNIDLYCNNCTF